MLKMVDSDYEFVIESKFPLVSPPRGPWRLRVTFDLDDSQPAELETESRLLVTGPLDEAVAKWQASDADYAQAGRLTESLNEVDGRADKLRADLDRLGRELKAALLNGQSVALTDKQIADARAELVSLEERKAMLTGMAVTSKDAAEASLRKTLKQVATRLGQDIIRKKLVAAGERLSEVAADALREVVLNKQAVAVASEWNLLDQFVPQALSGVRPDGLAIDRKWAALIPAGSDNRHAAVN